MACLNLFKRQKVLTGLILLCAMWSITFVYVMRKELGKNLQSKAYKNNSTSMNEAKVKELEDQVEKLKENADEYNNLLQKLREEINELIKQKEGGNEKWEKVDDILGVKNTMDVIKVVPVLVLAFNRPSVSRCLDLLIKYRSTKEQFPIIVSQDGNHKETADVINGYGDKIVHLNHPPIEVILPAKEKKFVGYYKLSSHYKWAINQIFELYPAATSLIIVEDDLDISPDFFSYFNATLPLLDRDPTLMCVSAWNDNGKSELVDSGAVKKLYRTDFFPGLGWMLKRDFWRELEPKWPKAFWDDWLRDPRQRRDRACIRPEISRTRTFGKKGVSNGQFFERHLKYIVLNEQPVEWKTSELEYLLKDRYDQAFLNQVYSLPLAAKAADFRRHGPAVRIEYDSGPSFKATAKYLLIMDDFKAGVPRTGYMGIVSLMRDGVRVYVAPDRTRWTGYVTSWT